MKSILTSILTIVLAITFTGCGSDDSSEQDNSPVIEAYDVATFVNGQSGVQTFDISFTKEDRHTGKVLELQQGFGTAEVQGIEFVETYYYSDLSKFYYIGSTVTYQNNIEVGLHGLADQRIPATVYSDTVCGAEESLEPFSKVCLAIVPDTNNTILHIRFESFATTTNPDGTYSTEGMEAWYELDKGLVKIVENTTWDGSREVLDIAYISEAE